MENGKKTSVAQISADASLLISEFSRKQRGETVTYEEIARLLGWDIRKNRSILTTVRNRLLRDYGIVLSAVNNVGYLVLTSEQIVDGELARDRSRRQRSARRSRLKAEAVDLSQLDDGQRLKCLGEIASAHIVERACSNKSVAQIEGRIEGDATSPLALNKALEAIQRNS